MRYRPAPIAVALALVLLAVPAAFTGVMAAPVVRAQTPPPTPVPPFGSPSPFPTALETPAPAPTPPRISAASAILQDLSTGQVLYAKADGRRRPIASVTKIMTALLALEEVDPSVRVTVSANAASQLGAGLGLTVGERLSVENLLYASMLQSSNDAAVVLAERVAGTESAFVVAMNARAVAMGLRDTRFLGPTGLDDGGYSTAREVAAITRAAYQWPLFARIVRTRFRTIPAPSGPDRRIQNRNVLLWLYSPTIGVKTGFTSAAGHCLVVAARFESMELLAVVLGAPDDSFSDGAALIDYGLRRFRRVTFLDRGESLGTLLLEGASVEAVAAEELIRLVREDHVDTIEYELRPAKDLRLPIHVGQKVGREVVFVNGKRAASVDAVAAAPVPPAPAPTPGQSPSLLDDTAVLDAVIRALLAAFG
jgi:D-alanyl-D-alanine carboxypeptidase (penicillin-binding protein 5/6)